MYYSSYILYFAGARSRSVSPTSVSMINRIQTPTRRSRRLSEMSNTPATNMSQESKVLEESGIILRENSVTPKKSSISGRTSPALVSLRRSGRTSPGPSSKPLREKPVTPKKSSSSGRTSPALGIPRRSGRTSPAPGTPRRSGRTSPAPGTPNRSRRVSGGSAHDVSTVEVMEPLVEAEEENEVLQDDYRKTEQNLSESGSTSMRTPTNVNKRSTNKRISEVTQLDVIEEDPSGEIRTPTDTGLTEELHDDPSLSKTKSKQTKHNKRYYNATTK